MKKIVSILLVCSMLLMTACTPQNATSQKISEDFDVTYNIIFTLATIPPVLAALDAISSGNETYAIIERGKTYSGIDRVEGFYNVGFNPANNLSTGFTEEEFGAMVKKVKELNDTDKNVFFNIYTQDGTALVGAAIAANAGLSTDQFHIYMVEDGVGAYNALYTRYFANNTVKTGNDEIYKAYCHDVKLLKREFDEILSKRDNAITDDVLQYSIQKAYGLAALDNFTYYLQDEDRITEILLNTGEHKTKLLSCFDNDQYPGKVAYTLNLKYQKIEDGVAKLTAEQKTAYLNLMYGQYYEDTYNTLVRTERADEVAPLNKLVYIGTRHSEYPVFASSEVHGIGGIQETAAIPESYSDLDDKYKSPLLFATESDYNAFLSEINDLSNYSEEMSEDARNKAKIATFNDYIDYMFALKFMYSLYGESYDIIMKGHPHEVIGSYTEWGDSYVVEDADGNTFNYNKLMDNVLLNFHKEDSIGKYIGMVPYGTAAENLAYLGVDLAICGLPSSTYAGYSTDVDVLNIFTESNQDIAGSGESAVDSTVSTRYEAGTLLYVDKNGNEQTTVFFNTGNIYKYAAEICRSAGNTDIATMYTEMYKQWLDAVYVNAVDINEQGFAVY